MVILLASIFLISITACRQNEEQSTEKDVITENKEEVEKTEEETEKEEAQNDESVESVTVGVSVLHEPTMKKAGEVFEKETGIKLNVKVFDDYVLPNTALEEGSIDCNFFQHKPYLDAFNESNGTDIKEFSYPGAVAPRYGLVSKKYKNVDEIPEGATIIIANDASNRAAGLHVLEEAGLLKLNDAEIPTVMDIVENPKNLEFVEVASQQVPVSLVDADAGTTNLVSYALADGDPNDMISEVEDDFYEGSSIVLAFRGSEDFPDWADDLDKAIRSDETKKFVEEHFKGSMKFLD